MPHSSEDGRVITSAGQTQTGPLKIKQYHENRIIIKIELKHPHQHITVTVVTSVHMEPGPQSTAHITVTACLQQQVHLYMEEHYCQDTHTHTKVQIYGKSKFLNVDILEQSENTW
ncbi:hypothetical protein E3U43_009368 [Larimichthys crocea]|uniref:Uncharacterized protein n=1 Tax=Larimichthys crocea TaxID=215358 RepID=A0ACD3QAJ5_LARCR|nr:hypothetical protein E3U43_009368 [Larimichthys crocea]